MRHATSATLDRLAPFLDRIRRLPGLRECKRGAFYRGGAGWLHFHEDPAGLFADLRIGGAFARFPLNTAAQRTALLKRLRASLEA
ncbi:MAG: hypothetical protein ACREEE_16845 [Dongiaceae bacterium]